MKCQKVKISCFITLLFFCFQNPSILIAQENLKLWTSYGATTRLTKELRIRGSQLLLFNQEPFELSSMQNSAVITYRINRKISFGVGYQRSSDPSNPNQEARNRLEGRFRYNARIGKIRLQNALRTEWHFPERSKFEYRIRYGLRIHGGSWGLPLKTTPFVTNEFHYYLSGRPLQYRDADGERLIKQSPDGLHAYRFTFGISCRPIKRIRASLSYMRQTEFNIGSKYREINVVDPRDGDIIRPFNNFSVLILNVSYQFDLRKKSSSPVLIGSRTKKRDFGIHSTSKKSI